MQAVKKRTGALTGRSAKRYRCDSCQSTSVLCITDAAYRTQEQIHRNRAHAGLIPDGERTIDVPLASIFHMPREQAVVTVLLVVTLATVLIVRLL